MKKQTVQAVDVLKQRPLLQKMQIPKRQLNAIKGGSIVEEDALGI